MQFIGVEVEQETSAPPPKKILDPPLDLVNPKKELKKKTMKMLTFVLSANILNYYNPTKRGGKV